MLNVILIIIFTLIIISQLFIQPKRENLSNINHLDILYRLISNKNIKNPEKNNNLIDFTREKNKIKSNII